MSEVNIKYSSLRDASQYANDLSNNLSTYAGEIARTVTKKLGNLPGNDNAGYANTAYSCAADKIRELNDNSTKFSDFAKKVNSFVENTIRADENVANSIRITASSYVGERSVWQGFCDFLWNAVCVDFVNGTTLGRLIKDCATTVWSGVTAVAERVRDWFKHGKGKYVWNMVYAVVSAVSAIVGVVTAIAAVVAAGTTAGIVFAVIAAIAAVVGAVITTVNSAVKIYNNRKAFKSDDPGVSRYLGTINGVSDAIEKYDMGDMDDNKNWEFGGKVVDGIKTFCDVIGFAKGVTDLAAVKSDITGRITGYEFNKNNIMQNIRKSMGFDFDKNQFTLKKMFEINSLDKTSSWFANENGYGGLKVFMNMYTDKQEAIKSFVKCNEFLSRAMKITEKADSVYENVKRGYDFSSTEATFKSIESIAYSVIDIYDSLGSVKVFSGINNIVVKPFKTIKSINENFKFTDYPFLMLERGGGGIR